MKSSSFSNSNQSISSLQNQAVLPILIFLGISGVVYFWAMSNFSNIETFATVLALMFFVLSFFSIKVGLIVMAFSMLFSPEISVGTIGIRSINIRIEDILIPILVLAWLARLAIRKEFRLFAHSPKNVVKIQGTILSPIDPKLE